MITPGILVHDGDELVDEGPWGRDITLAVTVMITVGSDDPATLGTALNAGYAQALLALWADPTLGGLVGDIVEGAFRPEVATEGAPTMSGELDLELTYRHTGTPGQREAICAALEAQLALNAPAAASRRETVLAAFAAQVATALGETVVRNRDRRQPAGMLAMADGPQVPVSRYTGEVIYAATPRLRLVVSTTDPAALGAAMNARVDTVRTAILAGDRRLGGLVDDIRDAEDALEVVVVTTSPAPPTMVADLTVTLLYGTAEDDPTAVAA